MNKFLISRERLSIITKMGLPVVLAIISGNLLAFVDMAMVGRLGRNALAGVGIGGLVFGLGTALISGLGIAVTAMTSRRRGAGKEDEYALPLNAALIIGTVTGLFSTIVCVSIVPYVFPFFDDNPDVIAQGAPYLRIAFISMLGSAWSSCLVGYWNGLGKTGIHLKILVFSQFLNIALNYILIFGKLGLPAMGTRGAALSTVLSLYISVIGYFFLMLRDPPRGFLRIWPEKQMFIRIYQLMLPSGIRAASGGLGSLVFVYIISRMGTVEVAVTTILMRILALMIFPITGVGVACSTLAGQALGRDDAEDAERWGWDGAKLALGCLLFMSIPAVFFPETMIRIFSDDPEIINLAKGPLIFLGLTRFVNLTVVLVQALNGVGSNKSVMIVGTILQWAYLYPALWVATIILKAEYMTIWYVFFSCGLMQFTIYSMMWRGGKWKSIVL